MPVMKGSVKGDDIGKIFVGGLALQTDKDGLQSYFEKFGAVVDCVLMTDQVTKTSRGFGFVTFSDPGTVQKVCAEKLHILDNKKIDPKPAVPRGSGQAAQPAMQQKGSNDFKVFIGGISHDTTEEDIMQYFNAFCACTHVQLINDKNTGKPRGFGFVTFQTKDDVEKAVETHFHQINGKTVEIKKAEHKPSGFKAGGQNPLATPPMQGGMGRGQYGQQMYMPGYGQQPGMQGMGRGGYGSYGSYGAVGSGAGFGYAPQAQGYGAGMGMGGAAPGAGGYPQSGYPANPQMSGYGAGAGREPAAASYGAPGYGGSYPTPGGMAPGAPAAGAQDYGQGLGNYQQQDSQYGPARGSFGTESGYSPYPSGESYGSTASAGGGYGTATSGAESFGRGGGGATRGFHPYGR